MQHCLHSYCLHFPSVSAFLSDFCCLFLFKCSALVELLKHKPKATDEQLKTVMENFVAFVDKCCAAADKEACFAVEVLVLSLL